MAQRTQTAGRRKTDLAVAHGPRPVTIGLMYLSRRQFCASLTALAAAPSFAAEVPIVFAAASLKPVLDDIAQNQIAMRLSYGGSGALARQIVQGAPADLFLSANAVWMEEVARARNLPAEHRRNLLGNRLVLVGGKAHSEVELVKWQPDGRIATGFVEAVPVGQYAKAAFENLGLWDMVRPLLVETENVRAALALVLRGEVPFAVVYETDALAEPAVQVLARFDQALHPKVVYPLARLTDRGAPFFEHLAGREAAARFRAFGFEVI